MNFKKTLQILSKDIEEIEKILGEIDISSPESRLVMQLALSKLKNLRENFGLFSTLLEGSQLPPPPPPPSAPGEERSATAPPAEEEPSSPAEPDHAVETDKAAEKEEKKMPAGSAEKLPEELPEEAVETRRSKAKPSKKTFSDTLHPQHSYRNEQLGREHPGGDLSSRISKSAITDLRKVINLNEKFMFIRDLFDGDKDRYEQTIRLLNKAQNRSEVEDLLQAFQWDAKSEAARTFREKVERKLKSLKNG